MERILPRDLEDYELALERAREQGMRDLLDQADRYFLEGEPQDWYRIRVRLRMDNGL